MVVATGLSRLTNLGDGLGTSVPAWFEPLRDQMNRERNQHSGRKPHLDCNAECRLRLKAITVQKAMPARASEDGSGTAVMLNMYDPSTNLPS